MKIPRIFVSSREICGRVVEFSDKNSRYLMRVLRLKAGDEVQAFDGAGEHLVELTSLGRDSVRGLIRGPMIVHEEQGTITLAFACVRPGPMQEILRHCTELGVSTFVPLLTARSNRRPQEKKERWESIVTGASAQCGRVTVPRVLAPAPLEDFLRELEREQGMLLLSRADGTRPIWAALEDCAYKNVVLLVGPEGGLDESEEAMATAAGFLPISLGPATLRAETAAILASGAVVINREFAKFCPQSA